MTDNNKVVEIKAPYAAKDTLNIHEAVESCKVSRISVNKSNTFLYYSGIII